MSKMAILSDTQIFKLAKDGMIEPFVSEQNHDGLSFGLSSYGYDIRCADKFSLFSKNSNIADPKNIKMLGLIDFQQLEFILPGHSFALTHSLEYIRMPFDTVALCVGKSTYARLGLIVNVTPIEPGWHGNITLELSNTSPVPIKIYANEGIAQLLFLRGEKCQTSYQAREGKYQGQTGITLPRCWSQYGNL